MKNMKNNLLILFILLVSLSYGQQKTTSNDTYDLVILNGRVMDPETMFDAIANVGVKDGKIVAITKSPIKGKETIVATGHVVAPGFIDTHYHATDPFASKMALRDGVTTGMDLEAGSFNVKDWYAEKAKTGWQLNYGTSASLLYNRMAVHDPETEMSVPVDFSTISSYAAKAMEDGVQGWAETKSTIEEMNKIMQLLDEDLRQGGIGLAAPIAYMAIGLSSYELFEAQKFYFNQINQKLCGIMLLSYSLFWQMCFHLPKKMPM